MDRASRNTPPLLSPLLCHPAPSLEAASVPARASDRAPVTRSGAPASSSHSPAEWTPPSALLRHRRCCTLPPVSHRPPHLRRTGATLLDRSSALPDQSARAADVTLISKPSDHGTSTHGTTAGRATAARLTRAVRPSSVPASDTTHRPSNDPAAGERSRYPSTDSSTDWSDSGSPSRLSSVE